MLGLLMASIITLSSCSDSDDNNTGGQPTPTDTTKVVSKFFTPEINKLIDENYKEVQAKGYAELVIPAAMFDHTAFSVPDNERSDLNYVAKAGYKTYICGGTVRDAVMGVSSNDVDFISDATPEQLVEVVPNTKIFTAPSGYKVAQAWHGDDRTDMGTIRAIYFYLRGLPGIPESKTPTDSTVNTYSKELWEDPYSRDLTINSIYYDYQTGNIIDFHGGLHDLREKIIRTVYDANLMFPTNASALLRAVRFAALFNFKVEATTDQALRQYLPEADKLGASGIAYNLTSGFHDGCMQRTYAAYKEYGILDRYFLTLKDFLGDASYNSYIQKAYKYLDEQKCNTTTTTMATLFLPPLKKAMATKEWTEQLIATTWNELEVSSRQNAFFEISESDKKTMCRLWYLVHQLSDATVMADPQQKAAIEKDELYPQAKLLQTAIAE